MDKDLGLHLNSIGGMQIPFHSYTFRVGEKTLYVFFCLYEERPGDAAIIPDPQFEQVDMYQRALQGRRHIGQQSLEFALSGYESEERAQKAFKAQLGEVLQAKK